MIPEDKIGYMVIVNEKGHLIPELYSVEFTGVFKQLWPENKCVRLFEQNFKNIYDSKYLDM